MRRLLVVILIAGLLGASPAAAEPAPLTVVSAGPYYASYLTTYQSQVVAAGGTAPYTFAVTGGALPGGLALATTGAITGVPSGPFGIFVFTVTATDSTQQTASALLSIQLGKGSSLLRADPFLSGLRFDIVKARLTGGAPEVPISGAQVQFKNGSTPVCTAVTTAAGVAQCKVGTVTGLQLLLAGSVTAVFTGDALWLPSTGVGSLLPPPRVPF